MASSVEQHYVLDVSKVCRTARASCDLKLTGLGIGLSTGCMESCHAPICCFTRFFPFLVPFCFNFLFVRH